MSFDSYENNPKIIAKLVNINNFFHAQLHVSKKGFLLQLLQNMESRDDSDEFHSSLEPVVIINDEDVDEEAVSVFFYIIYILKDGKHAYKS